MIVAGDQLAVDLDGHELGTQLELDKQASHGGVVAGVVRVPIEGDIHRSESARAVIAGMNDLRAVILEVPRRGDKRGAATRKHRKAGG
jgi:hypothetical protein